VIVDGKNGKICICDVCGQNDPHGRWIYQPGDEERKRCRNRKCRHVGWNLGGQDRRTWPRVNPASLPATPSAKNSKQ